MLLEVVVEEALEENPFGESEVTTPYWQHVLDEADVQWLIARPETPLAETLQEQQAPATWNFAAAVRPGFQLWIRNIPENEEMLERARAVAPLVGGVAP